jgi:hypothetical protein
MDSATIVSSHSETMRWTAIGEFRGQYTELARVPDPS